MNNSLYDFDWQENSGYEQPNALKMQKKAIEKEDEIKNQIKADNREL